MQKLLEIFVNYSKNNDIWPPYNLKSPFMRVCICEFYTLFVKLMQQVKNLKCHTRCFSFSCFWCPTHVHTCTHTYSLNISSFMYIHTLLWQIKANSSHLFQSANDISVFFFFLCMYVFVYLHSCLFITLFFIMHISLCIPPLSLSPNI